MNQNQNPNQRKLVISQVELEKIARALELARQRPIPVEIVKSLAIPDKPVVRLKDRPKGYRPVAEFVELPVGFLVAVSFEEQPGGLFTHLSISVDKKGKLPDPYAIREIAQRFGLSGNLPPTVGNVWVEEFKPGYAAMNILELANAATLS